MLNAAISAPLGLFETMRLDRAGQVLLLAYHLQRLARSAQQLGFVFDQDAILRNLNPYLHQSYSQPQRLKLSINKAGKVSVECAALATTPQPVRIALTSQPIHCDPLYLRHKTTVRTQWASGEKWLQKHPTYFDLIYTDQYGALTEGGRSTLYVFQQGKWFTPPLTQALLPGVYRNKLVAQGLVQEKTLYRTDLIHADRIRVSNALRGWLDAYIDELDVNV